jgi:hypothetical protein
MDLPRLSALSKYWSEWPPVHIAVAAYVGWGSSKKSSASASDLDTLMASLPEKEFNPHG